MAISHVVGTFVRFRDCVDKTWIKESYSVDNTKMFGDSCTESNGELEFYEKIKPNIKTIFDVGCRDCSLFLDFEGEVHYFDPNPNHIADLTKNPTRNPAQKAKFNTFGLGNTNEQAYYYPVFESFHDRVVSCQVSNEIDRILYEVRRGDEYIWDNGVQSIDFLKIDTEGHEYAVLMGFGYELNRVKMIQFEYGGTWQDSEILLVEVIEFLKERGFREFSYLAPGGELIPVDPVEDHYKYCNIIATR